MVMNDLSQGGWCSLQATLPQLVSIVGTSTHLEVAILV